MKIHYGILATAFMAALALTACGGGGGGGGTPGPGPGPNPNPDSLQITTPAVPPIVSYTQCIASHDTDTFSEVFPGCANIWSIDQDFALVDGFDLQFDSALVLSVGTTTFPSNQGYGELTWYKTAVGGADGFGAADGVKVAAVSDGATVFPAIAANPLGGAGVRSVMTGSYAAFLNATSDSRLQQTLDLTGVPVNTDITLNWTDVVNIAPGNITDNTGYEPSYRVNILAEDGTLLKTLSTGNQFSNIPKTHTGILLNPYAGRKIVLSFEEKSSTFSFSQSWVIIDAVTVYTGTAIAKTHEFVTNGGFESGDLTGWTTNTPAEIQNVTSGARNVEGLTVKRSFYTVPSKLWGRWVDVFENNTGTAITKTVTYDTDLGSDGSGIIYGLDGAGNIYRTATTQAKALTSWDSQTGDRDVGLVFGGNTSSVVFTTDDGTGTKGSDIIKVSYTITVPAGGRVAIVNFVIMDGVDTGVANPGTLNPLAQATDIDTQAATIVNNFRTDAQYTAGLTQQQIDAIYNF